jgi:uncharacterized protein
MSDTKIRKILNDPVHGFITIHSKLILEIIDHPYFQRLRRIKQLGLTHLVYPGALHTRFHHALGCLHLMQKAIDTLRLKGIKISEKESEAAQIAILLHDIGHGPFSHALENTIVHDVSHEDLSLLFMNNLNSSYGGKLDVAIKIFTNKYPKKFLHQLVSSQLDVDRLDYLKRDSFYTGVSEGIISTDRIITMMNVFNDNLVVEEKGLYSIENFIIARRLMYWQVYLHKTSLSAEMLMVHILQRAKDLAQKGVSLFCTDAFSHFLYQNYSLTDFNSNSEHLKLFAQLDDSDISISIKTWVNHSDKTLSILCKKLMTRNLNRIELTKEKTSKKRFLEMQSKIKKAYDLETEDLKYFIFTSSVENKAYDISLSNINIMKRNKKLIDITEASDQHNISALAKPVAKHIFSYPKEINYVEK